MNTLFLILALTLIASAQIQTNWSTAILSVARQGLVATSNGNWTFFAGGENATNGINTLDIWNFNVDPPKSSTGTITGQNGIAATSVGDFVFFAGGYVNGVVSRTIDVWKVSTSAFQAKVNLSEARAGLAAVTVDDYAIFAGGNNSQNASATVDVYNGTAWSTAQLSQARSGLVGVASSGMAFFAGGWINENTTSATIDIWDSQTGNWTTATLTTARAEFAAVAWDDLVYFAGGVNSSGGFLDSVEIYNTTSGQWETPTALSEPRANLAGAAYNGFVYFAGGRAQSGYSDIVDIYSNNSQIPETLALARGDLASTVNDAGIIFFAGGIASNGVSALIDVGQQYVPEVPTPTPTPSPEDTPTPTPSPEDTPTPTPSVIIVTTPTPTPSPGPAIDCNETCYPNFLTSNGTQTSSDGYTKICGWWQTYRDCVTNTTNGCDDSSSVTDAFESQCSAEQYVGELCSCDGNGNQAPSNERLLALMDTFNAAIIAALETEDGVQPGAQWTYDNTQNPPTASISFSYEDTQTDVNQVITSLQTYLADYFAQSSTRFIFNQQKKRDVQTVTFGVSVQDAQDQPTGSASSVAFSLGFTMLIALFNVFF